MKKAAEIISDLFKDRFGPGFMDKARQNAGLFSSWNKIVAEAWPASYGLSKDDIPAAASHSQIRELERGLLLIEADHPGWIQILQTKQRELLSAVQRKYPELNVRGIAFRLSRGPFSAIPAAAMPAMDMPVTKQDGRDYESASRNKDALEDEEFYAALKGLEKTVKKRNSLS